MKRITPENIKELKENEIFIFGSNEKGLHGAGAAKLAFEKFGAIWGKGYGFQGNSFAIPTKDENIKTLSLYQIQGYIDSFIGITKQNPNLKFLVTAIGCGLAGYRPKNIAPLFRNAVDVENIYLPEIFWKILIDK